MTPGETERSMMEPRGAEMDCARFPDQRINSAIRSSSGGDSSSSSVGPEVFCAGERCSTPSFERY